MILFCERRCVAVRSGAALNRPEIGDRAASTAYDCSRAKPASSRHIRGLFQPEALPMPSVRTTAQDGNILQAGRKQRGCGALGTPIGLAHEDDRSSERDKFLGSARHVRERDIACPGQMAGRRGKLLRLADIDQHQLIARGKPTLQVPALDPPRLRHARAPE